MAQDAGINGAMGVAFNLLDMMNAENLADATAAAKRFLAEGIGSPL